MLADPGNIYSIEAIDTMRFSNKSSFIKSLKKQWVKLRQNTGTASLLSDRPWSVFYNAYRLKWSFFKLRTASPFYLFLCENKKG